LPAGGVGVCACALARITWRMPEGVWGPHELGYIAHTVDLCPTPSVDGTLKFACSTFSPEATNFVEVLSLSVLQRVERGSQVLPHYYPPSRVRWLDVAGASDVDLVTSGDYIRLWSSSKSELRHLLRHEANPQGVCTPITSVSPCSQLEQLASCDVYGLCSLWDLKTCSLKAAIDLGQPLYDVALRHTPHGELIVAAGERGDLFVIDPRSPQNVDILNVQEHVGGPARIAWAQATEARQAPGLLAVSWQGEQGGLALYDVLSTAPRRGGAAGKMLRVRRSAQQRSSQAGRWPCSTAAVADVQWSPAHPEFLCAAGEDGVVEVWQVPQGASAAAAAPGGPCFQWEPQRGQSCTALALTPELLVEKEKRHLLVLASTPAQVADDKPLGSRGSLWVANLPEPALHQAPSRTVQLPTDAAPPAEPSDAAPPSRMAGPPGAGVTAMLEVA